MFMILKNKVTVPPPIRISNTLYLYYVTSDPIVIPFYPSLFANLFANWFGNPKPIAILPLVWLLDLSPCILQRSEIIWYFLLLFLTTSLMISFSTIQVAVKYIIPSILRSTDSLHICTSNSFPTYLPLTFELFSYPSCFTKHFTEQWCAYIFELVLCVLGKNK